MLSADVAPRKCADMPATDETPIVFIVDDDISIRESLEPLIESVGWHAKTCATAKEFLDHPRPEAASCMILDVNLPDLNGLDLQKMIASERAEMPVIILTGYGDVPMTVRAMKAGALEFLSKPISGALLLEAIEQALTSSRAALARAAETADLRRRYASLTHREQEVMALVASGLLNKQVAFELGITEVTVKAHRGQVMRKMKAHSLAELVNMAATLGRQT